MTADRRTQKPQNIEISSLEDFKREINKIKFTYPCVIGLDGELGAGKTEFVRQFTMNMGENAAAAEISSPTFSLHNQYALKDGRSIHHFDFYRLNSAEELAGIGFWDLFEEPAFVIIEWPRWIVPDKLPWVYYHIQIRVNADGTRRLCL